MKALRERLKKLPPGRGLVMYAIEDGMDVPEDIVAAAMATETDPYAWGRFARTDYGYTRRPGTGPTWVQRMDKHCPGWRGDQP